MKHTLPNPFRIRRCFFLPLLCCASLLLSVGSVSMRAADNDDKAKTDGDAPKKAVAEQKEKAEQKAPEAQTEKVKAPAPQAEQVKTPAKDSQKPQDGAEREAMRRHLEKVRDEIVALRQKGDQEGANRKMEELRKHFGEHGQEQAERAVAERGRQTAERAAAEHARKPERKDDDDRHHGDRDDADKKAHRDGEAAHGHRAEHPAANDRVRHLREAAEHLEAAGLKDEAHSVRELAERVLHEVAQAGQNGSPESAKRIEELERKIDQLQRDIEALRQRLGNSKEVAQACEACAKAKNGKCEKCAAEAKGDAKCPDCAKAKDGKCEKCAAACAKDAAKCPECAKAKDGKCEKCAAAAAKGEAKCPDCAKAKDGKCEKCAAAAAPEKSKADLKPAVTPKADKSAKPEKSDADAGQGRAQATEIQERFSKMSDEQKNELRKSVEKLRKENPNMSREEQGDALLKLLNESAAPDAKK